MARDLGTVAGLAVDSWIERKEKVSREGWNYSLRSASPSPSPLPSGTAERLFPPYLSSGNELFRGDASCGAGRWEMRGGGGD